MNIHFISPPFQPRSNCCSLRLLLHRPLPAHWWSLPSHRGLLLPPQVRLRTKIEKIINRKIELSGFLLVGLSLLVVLTRFYDKSSARDSVRMLLCGAQVLTKESLTSLGSRGLELSTGALSRSAGVVPMSAPLSDAPPQWGVTKPISLASPTPADEALTGQLVRPFSFPAPPCPRPFPSFLLILPRPRKQKCVL